MLLSKAKLKEVRGMLEQRCWQAFDDHLAPHAWAASAPHYKANRALVQAESLEARLAAFAAANEARLRLHFNTILDHSLASYNVNRSQTVLPAPEAEVEAQHSRLTLWTRELLTGPVKDLTDTDAFKGVRDHLDRTMAQGLQQLREKNIELWKAHSDDATRCAVAANQAAEDRCGAIGLFNTVPWVHQARSRRHLGECFTRSPIGSRMSEPLRAHVFDAWYHKDLSRDVQRVRSRFTALLVTVAAAAAGIAWLCRRRGRKPDRLEWRVPCYGQPRQPQGYSRAHCAMMGGPGVPQGWQGRQPQGPSSWLNAGGG